MAKANVIIRENFLSPAEFEACVDEVLRNKQKFERHDWDGKSFGRLYITEASHLTETISKKLFSAELINEVYRHHDLTWQWYRMANNVEFQVTSYGNGDSYGWHTDHGIHVSPFIPRVANFVLYLTEGFKGGELRVSDELCLPFKHVPRQRPILNSYLIEPKKNRLVIMPSYVFHRVEEVVVEDGKVDLMDTRVTINGHMQLVY